MIGISAADGASAAGLGARMLGAAFEPAGFTEGRCIPLDFYDLAQLVDERSPDRIDPKQSMDTQRPDEPRSKLDCTARQLAEIGQQALARPKVTANRLFDLYQVTDTRSVHIWLRLQVKTSTPDILQRPMKSAGHPRKIANRGQVLQ